MRVKEEHAVSWFCVGGSGASLRRKSTPNGETGGGLPANGGP